MKTTKKLNQKKEIFCVKKQEIFWVNDYQVIGNALRIDLYDKDGENSECFFDDFKKYCELYCAENNIYHYLEKDYCEMEVAENAKVEVSEKDVYVFDFDALLEGMELRSFIKDFMLEEKNIIIKF